MTDDGDTQPIPELDELRAGTRHVDRHRRRDWLRITSMGSCLATFAIAGAFANWTHRAGLQVFDALIALAALAEFVRLLLSRPD